MKAWHVSDRDADLQEIVFADKRHEAIYKSEVYRWCGYTDVRIKRAPYADGLENEPKKLKQAMLENGWWFECKNCREIVTIDDIDIEDNITVEGDVFCNCCAGLHIT